MNVREFREWLNQFDDDVEVRVLVQEEPGPYESYGSCVEMHFEGTDYYDYFDATTNEFVTENHPCYGHRILTLGERE